MNDDVILVKAGVGGYELAWGNPGAPDTFMVRQTPVDQLLEAHTKLQEEHEKFKEKNRTLSIQLDNAEYSYQSVWQWRLELFNKYSIPRHETVCGWIELGAWIEGVVNENQLLKEKHAFDTQLIQDLSIQLELSTLLNIVEKGKTLPNPYKDLE